MSNEPTLAATVHYGGRKYRAGMTAEEIGPAAEKIGAHAWVDGRAPAKTAKAADTGGEGGEGGEPAGRRVLPTPSALPTPAAPAEPDAGEGEGEGGAKKVTTGNRRGGGQG